MKNALIRLTITLLLAVSCSGSLFSPDNGPDRIQGNDNLHEMIVLGDKLEDPYSVENMTKALTSLYPTKAGRIQVEPSHLYIRFLPANEQEFDRLVEIGIELIDHPVDFQIIREGDYYHDPSLDEDSITWQYAVIAKDFEYPKDIRHEVLDQCYIPIGERDTKAGAGDIDWDAVERQSYMLTGNSSLLLDTRAEVEVAARPSGRITIRDEERNETIGVKGVKVSCNTFVKFASAFTDEEGNYYIDTKFSSSPRYRIVFKNKKGFGIGVNLILCPASFSSLGKHSSKGVTVNVTSASERKLFTRCVVNNAAYDYYSSCRKDDYTISSPPANLRIWIFRNLKSSSAVMLQQGVLVDGSFVEKYLGEYTFLLKIFLPDITLGLRDAEKYSEIYGLAIHELSHASHFMQVGKQYWNTYAEFILKSFITSGFVCYGTGLEDNSGYCEIGEMWAYYNQSKFLRERYNSDAVYGTNYWFYPQIFLYLDDRGVTRWKLFAALTEDIYARDKLKKKLISLYPQSKTAINQAFSRYQ